MMQRFELSGCKKSIYDWLITHRHGVMGTVIFHLLLGICLVSMGISKMETHREMEIELTMPEPEIVQQAREEMKKKEEMVRQSADEEVSEMLRSLAVNEDAADKAGEPRERAEEYIEQIQRELQGDYGSRYQAKKNKYFKEDSIRVRRDRKERMLDSLQATVYVGKSSVSYNIKGRYKTYLPIPIFKCEFGGKVVVAVVVNRQGRVIKAEVVDAESRQDDYLREVAMDAASRSEFNADEKAAARQPGTITYNFVKQ